MPDTGKAEDADKSVAWKRESSVERASRSFLNPTGLEPHVAPPKEVGPAMEVFIFMVLVVVKAFHPVIIEASKTLDEVTGKRAFLYNTNSTIVAKDVVIAVASIVLCFVVGGKKQFDSIWDRRPLIVFAINGAMYTMADVFEMACMGGLDAASQQIVMQSSIPLTALMMMSLKGVFQTRLQWILLFIIMLSVSAYMVIASGGQSKGGQNTMAGLTFALLKVFFLTLGSVVSDKYAKVYKSDPTHVQIARIYAFRPCMLILASWAFGKMDSDYFVGWDGVTCLLLLSFIVKAISSQYVVALLDSILKTIAESFAVLVIYLYDVLAPWQGKPFQLPTFLSVLVVVAACASYVDSKSTIEKAAQYDLEQKGQ